jgi:hypothetical protein
LFKFQDAKSFLSSLGNEAGSGRTTGHCCFFSTDHRYGSGSHGGKEESLGKMKMKMKFLCGFWSFTMKK